MAIEAIFSACSAAQTAAHLLGFIESVDAKVDKLLQADLATAQDLLRQSAMSAKESESLLREARTHFTRAAQVEDGLRKGLALLGLAACHHRSGEARLTRDSLERILNIDALSTRDFAAGSIKPLAMNVLKDWSGLRHMRMLFDSKARDQYVEELTKDSIRNTPGAEQLLELQDSVGRYLAT